MRYARKLTKSQLSLPNKTKQKINGKEKKQKTD